MYKYVRSLCLTYTVSHAVDAHRRRRPSSEMCKYARAAKHKVLYFISFFLSKYFLSIRAVLCLLNNEPNVNDKETQKLQISVRYVVCTECIQTNPAHTRFFYTEFGCLFENEYTKTVRAYARVFHQHVPQFGS